MPKNAMKPKKTLVDLLLVAGTVAVFWVVASVTELSERVAKFSLSYEALQVDELPLTLLVLCMGLLWFAWRRTLVVQTEMNERIRSEHKVQELLKHNSDLLQRLFTAEEDERRALARELHDDMGQTSTAIRTEVAVLQRSGGLNEDAQASAQRIGESAQHLSNMTRQMLQRLRPAVLDSLGLRQALTSMCEQWQISNHTLCYLSFKGEVDHLNDYASVTLYRIVQEALTNVSRHAKAHQVTVELALDAQGMQLKITDDGQGMADAQAVHTGFGLLGMQERVASLSGHLDITSKLGHGVSLVIQIPRASL
jgi:glucose-6-phosphate-specific signal transduction histidine kinase